VYPIEKVRHYDADEVKRYMARKLAARRQKQLEEKHAEQQKQQRKQQQLQQLYDYQKRHLAACIPKYKKVKLNETFCSNDVHIQVHVHEDSDKENNSMRECQRGRTTVTDLMRLTGETRRIREPDMPIFGLNKESVVPEYGVCGDQQGQPISSGVDSEESEHTLTPPKTPEHESQMLPEVMPVNIEEPSRNQDSESMRPVTSKNSPNQKQDLRLRMLHQSAISLTERIEEETRRLKEAGVLSQATKMPKPSPLPSTLWTDSCTGQFRDGAFQVEDLPGVVSLDRQKQSYEQWHVPAVNGPHKMQSLGDDLATGMHMKNRSGASSLVREIGMLAKREDLSKVSDRSDMDSLSTDSTESLLKSDLQQRDSSRIKTQQDLNQPLSYGVQDLNPESEYTSTLPWQQHGGDPYSVINIFTRKQTGNVTKGFSQKEEQKDDIEDDSTITESSRQEDQEEAELSLSDEIGSEIGSTHSLTQDISLSKVIVKKPEITQKETQVRNGWIPPTLISEERDVGSLLVDQSLLGTDLDVGAAVQLHPSESVAATVLTAKAETTSAGDFPMPNMSGGPAREERFSPDALGLQFSTELHLLDSIDQSMQHLGALERAHAVSLAQQETVSLSQLLKGKQEQHRQEIDSLAQKLKDDLAAVERQLTNECNKVREETLESRREIASTRSRAEEVVDAATKTQAEILEQVTNVKRELDEVRLMSVACPAHLPEMVPVPQPLSVSTVTASVSAAVDGLMKNQGERVVRQRDHATMTSEQDDSVMSSEFESATTESLNTASLLKEMDHSEVEDQAMSEETMPPVPTADSHSVLLTSKLADDSPECSSQESHCVSVTSHTITAAETSSPEVMDSNDKGETTAHQSHLSHVSSQVISPKETLITQTDSKAPGKVTQSEEAISSANYSMQFEESGATTVTAEELQTNTKPELDEQSFRLLLPSESHRRHQELQIVAESSRQASVSASTDSQDEMAITSCGTMSPFSGDDSFHHFTTRMARQLLEDEEMRAQHQAALLRLREKAMREKTKAELAWLKHKEQRLQDKGEDDKMPPIRKRRQEILNKLHTERAEIKRLKAANKVASHERRMLLIQQKEITKMHKTTKFYLGQLKKEAPNQPHLTDESAVLLESPKSVVIDEISTDQDISKVSDDDIEMANPSLVAEYSEMTSKPTSVSVVTRKSHLVDHTDSNASQSTAHSQDSTHTHSTVSTMPEQREIMTIESGRPSLNVVSVPGESQTLDKRSFLLVSERQDQSRDETVTSILSQHSLASVATGSKAVLPHSPPAVDSCSHPFILPAQPPVTQTTVPSPDPLAQNVTSPSSSDNGVIKSLRRLEAQSSERYLTKREQKLRKRRQQAERILKSRKELLEWQNRLDEEEAELQRMVDEAMGLKIRRRRPREGDSGKQSIIELKESYDNRGNQVQLSTSTDMEAAGGPEESSATTVADEVSMGTDYGSETFESLEKTMTTQQENSPLTLTTQKYSSLTSVVKQTDDGQTRMTERRLTNDIGKRIRLLKEELVQRKAEAKRLQEERRQALLDEEARLKYELENVERTISKHKEKLAVVPQSEDTKVFQVSFSEAEEKEKEVIELDNFDIAEELRESMKTPARHELSTYSTFDEKVVTDDSQPEPYSASTFTSSLIVHTHISNRERDASEFEQFKDVEQQQDTFPTDASFSGLHIQTISSPRDDQHSVSMSPPSVQDQQVSASKTYSLDSFESSVRSSTPQKLPTISTAPSLGALGSAPEAEATYSDTFIPSLQSLDAVVGLKPTSETVKPVAISSEPCSELAADKAVVSEVATAEQQMHAFTLQVGLRVLVDGNRAGVLQYFGTTHFARGMWAGVELDLPTGNHDGCWHGQRYFQCTDHHGIFVTFDKVKVLEVEQGVGNEDNIIMQATEPLPCLQSLDSGDIASPQADSDITDKDKADHVEEGLAEQQLDIAPPVQLESGSDELTPLADDDSELLRIISSAAEAVESFRHSLTPSVTTDQDEMSMGECEDASYDENEWPQMRSSQHEVEETMTLREQKTSIPTREAEDEVNTITASVLDLLVTESVHVMSCIVSNKQRMREYTAVTGDHDVSPTGQVTQQEQINSNLFNEAVVNQLLFMLFDEAVKVVKPLFEGRTAEHKCYHIAKPDDDDDTSLDNSSISISSGMSDTEPHILSPDYDTKFPTIMLENREELHEASIALAEPEEVSFFIPFDVETVSSAVRSSLHDNEYLPPKSDIHTTAFNGLLTDAIQEVSHQLMPVEVEDTSERLVWRKPRRYHRKELKRLKTSRQASDLEGLTSLVENQLLGFLGLNSVQNKKQNDFSSGSQPCFHISKAGETTTNTIEGILVEELREEESQWIDYDDDETRVKFQLADGILDTLLQETAIVTQGVQNEKQTRQEL
jgi:centrosomal protein CEP350